MTGGHVSAGERTALALAAAMLSTLAFAAIAGVVLDGGATRLDQRIADRAAALDLPTLDSAMRVVTSLGSFAVLAVVALAVAAWAFVRRARALAGIVVAVTFVAEALVYGLKAIFRRERPELVDLVPLTTYAFPSAHAMVSTAVYGTVALAVARLRPSIAPLAYVGTTILVLAIGLSRIVLGVHWTTDVLAGFAAGALVLAAARLAMASPAVVAPSPTRATPTRADADANRSSRRSPARAPAPIRSRAVDR